MALAKRPKFLVCRSAILRQDSRNTLNLPTQFNGERIEDWEKTREIAREIEKTWWETGSLPEELSLLRAVLLIQVRYARFVEGYPSEADMPYLDALVATIKEKLSNISE